MMHLYSALLWIAALMCVWGGGSHLNHHQTQTLVHITIWFKFTDLLLTSVIFRITQKIQFYDWILRFRLRFPLTGKHRALCKYMHSLFVSSKQKMTEFMTVSKHQKVSACQCQFCYNTLAVHQAASGSDVYLSPACLLISSMCCVRLSAVGTKAEVSSSERQSLYLLVPAQFHIAPQTRLAFVSGVFIPSVSPLNP